MMSRSFVLAVLAIPMVAACAGTARSPQAYRADTQRVLATRNEQIKRCYDKLLASEVGIGHISGTITVHFVVEKETGAFTKAAIAPEATRARDPLVWCVLEALGGLKLDPPDENEGHAAFRYDLRPVRVPR